ncbi:aspartate dehydrogenase [Bordetella sputigena]|uniref:aspartate dehydrogenase n=1 Tax=Bordetella sputigena TaxID=1416810 RepID=UPI0039EEF009
MAEQERGRAPQRIALIGFGAMGGHVHRALADDAGLRITDVIVPPELVDETQARLQGQARVVGKVGDIDTPPDFALECAGHQAVAGTVPQLLARGVDVIIASVGALSQDGLLESLERAALQGGAQLTLVPGAVAGIDALAAARQQGLVSVEYIGRKAPAGWRGTAAERKLDLDALAKPTVFFEGTAREAAALYPKNANVAAMVGLAGIGLDRTRVTLVADPAALRNHHRIIARGEFGDLDIQTAGVTLPDNPKTSMLAALSIVRAVRNRVAGVVI